MGFPRRRGLGRKRGNNLLVPHIAEDCKVRTSSSLDSYLAFKNDSLGYILVEMP